MSNRKLTKFPVIAEDGTEYRVRLVDPGGDDDYVVVLIYDTFFGLYWPWSAFGIKVNKYHYGNYADVVRAAFGEWNRRRYGSVIDRVDIDAFQAWDGRL